MLFRSKVGAVDYWETVMVKLYQTWLVGVFAMLCALSAQATSPFDRLTTAVSFTDVSAALFVVAAARLGEDLRGGEPGHSNGATYRAPRRGEHCRLAL